MIAAGPIATLLVVPTMPRRLLAVPAVLATLAALQCVVSGGGSLGGELARETGGRLFVRGRTHDMIVSGGENVGPWKVEAVRASHQHVVEAAAVGVADRRYGQRWSRSWCCVRIWVSMQVSCLIDWTDEWRGIRCRAIC